MRTIYVVAGLIMREDRVLLDRRGPEGKLAGKWEFPGGKRENGEQDVEALRRELMEELGVTATIREEVGRTHYQTDELDMTLVLYSTDITGEPEALDVDAIDWFELSQLETLEMPPADRMLVPEVLATFARRRRRG